MSYLVLARKWRPKSFSQLVGQEHVLRPLKNALEQKRLHHAYLFSGSWGIGKTTLARILAKCLNCENDIASEPCGTCSSCVAIDEGQSVDVFEIDAASRTKVEDTRDLLETVAYPPVSSRFKIFIIDEVHMLSGHSFNALLKTLEEPPPHVKFIFATTESQKLPSTVLSRCLQFHLKPLSVERLTQHLDYILQEEKIAFEAPALMCIANSAHGSVRDALSLLDQAIGLHPGKVRESDVRDMLGILDPTTLWDLLSALIEKKSESLFASSQAIAERGGDFTEALEDLIRLFYELALQQADPKRHQTFFDSARLLEWAPRIPREDLQLYYQIALLGRRDLSFAPSERIGFEMTLLRMLAFQPVSVAIESKNDGHPVPSLDPFIHEGKTEITDWAMLCRALPLDGVLMSAVQHCALKSFDHDELCLTLQSAHRALLNTKNQERLQTLLQDHFQRPIRLRLEEATGSVDSPAELRRAEEMKRVETARDSLNQDSKLQSFLHLFDGKISEFNLVEDPLS